MFQSIRQYLRDSFALGREIAAAEQQLLNANICRGEHFQGISAAQGTTSRNGLLVKGIISAAVARAVAETLLKEPGKNQLVYFQDPERTVFCGEHRTDERQIKPRVESLQRQLQHESGELLLNGEGSRCMLLELAVSQAARETVPSVNGEVDLDTSEDEFGVYVAVGELPSEDSARALQRRVLAEQRELVFSVRFLYQESWHLFFKDHIPRHER